MAERLLMIKRFFGVCFSIFLIISAFSCTEKKEYSDGIPCDSLLAIGADAAATASGYEAMSKSRSEYAFDSLTCDEYAVFVSIATENIDEIGVFHASTPEASQKLRIDIEKYISDLLEEKGAFIASYAPAELEKLEKAQVRIYGNYVAYAILSRDGREAFFTSIENTLK